MKTKEMILAQKANAQAMVDAFDSMEAQLAVDLQSEYDRGYVDGKATTGEPGDKLYTQVELDEEIALAMAPLNASVSSLQEQVTALGNELDSKVAAAVAVAVSEGNAKLVEMKAKVEAFLNSENEEDKTDAATLLASL